MYVPEKSIFLSCCCYRNYRFIQFIQNTRFARENEAFSLASELSIKVTRRSLGHENDSKKNEMIMTVWREKELEQGIKHLVLEILSGQFWASGKYVFFRNLRCADRRNRLLSMNSKKIGKNAFSD